MKNFAPPLIALMMTATAAFAEEPAGPSLMERGAQLFLEGMLNEMAPAIEEFEGLADDLAPVLRGFADEMGPKLAEILGQVEDWSAYDVPEILPNGDIIIRRKADRPLTKPDTEKGEAPQIDL